MENIKNKKSIKRTFQGIVVSDKMDKTIVARVDRIKIHPKYKKRYKVSKRYKVHDPENKYKTGDKVIFIECRPLSKEKKWKVKEEQNNIPNV
ncbi:30S ribosomal protein S17 [Candidatus Kuenenbacteria bacterium HGW-Kuenenbacteria-1]|uniref:Small ribosomal subunit protein uS17 n=1 Tax=Candidatus Kuenenbacteria bacterium HGW-Kuenenbacteria-1 TaxID=2013812 RepID=A0A2N1UNF5_9BACT|nr:MAG: 30S ribosomal protein S17 [Candidatus Kuenenbacteria bacterium HGW-Kuenenbacteria-1]